MSIRKVVNGIIVFFLIWAVLMLADFSLWAAPSGDQTLSGNETLATNASSTDSNASAFIIKKPDTDFHWYQHRDILPWEYAEVTEQPAKVYPAPMGNLAGKRPVRTLDGGFIWVSLETPAALKMDNYRWYYINPGEYVLADNLVKRPVSTFKGINFSTSHLDARFAYGWIVLDTVTSAVPGKQEYIDGQYLDKHYLVRILGSRMVNGKQWLKLAKDNWVSGDRVGLITKPKKPAGIPPGVKWIDINLYEQVLEAFDGDSLVYATLISSGLPKFETPTGLYRLWGKVRMAKMGGGVKGKDYYFLEDVPYHMYFFQGYAIHGAYWHDNFGIKQSHGCVNIAPRDSYWLFNWSTPRVTGSKWVKSRRSNPGTYVYVHY